MSTKLFIAGLALIPATAIVARAEVYMSFEAAAQILFPGIALKEKQITLTDDQVRAIEQASGENVRNKNLRMLIGPKKEVVFLDQVVGKHEFITYAAAITPEGKIAGLEILEYKETYGHQVRNAEWRKQFTGKGKEAALKVNDDIKNISGATLSSVHVTGGARRLVQTYDRIRNHL